MQRTATVAEIGRLQESLAAGAVAAGVAPDVKVAAFCAALPQRSHSRRVSGIARRVQAVVERDVQRALQSPEGVSMLGHQLERGDAARSCSSRVLGSMVVGVTGE